MTDEDDETRLVRRDELEDVTRLVRREEPEDATRLVRREEPEDGEATRLIDRDDSVERTVLRGGADSRPQPPRFEPTAFIRAFVPAGVGDEPAEVYGVRGVEQQPVRRVDLASSVPARHVVARAHEQPRGARRGSRTAMILIALAAVVVLAAIVAAVAFVVFR